jgi:hypothetical protein
MIKGLRAWVMVGAIALGGATTVFAAGKNDIFDAFISALQGAKDELADADDARVDAAIAVLEESSDTDLTADVKSLGTAIKKLGKLPTTGGLGDEVDGVLDVLYTQVVGMNAQGAAAASNYYAGKPVNISNGKKLFAIVKQVAGRQAKLEKLQGTENASPAKRIALYLSVCKASAALIKKYGAVG